MRADRPSEAGFVLDGRSLSRSDIESWVDFIDMLACLAARPALVSVVGLAAEFARQPGKDHSSTRVRHADTCSIDWGCDQAFVFGSHTLTPAIVRTVSNIHIFPAGPPAAINHSIHDDDIRWTGYSQTHTGSRWEPRCSILTSLFDGERYLPGFLANAAGIQDYDAMEHWIVRAASPGDEHEHLIRHGIGNRSLIYLWLAVDPGLYDVWNLSARLSTAPYLGNANVDDRRAPTHISTLIDRLDMLTEVDVGSTALRVTERPNQPWEEPGETQIMFGCDQDATYGVDALLKQGSGNWRSRNLPHCMPVWRSALHVGVGYFDERRYGPSADWEFWLRCGFSGSRFHQICQALGLHLKVADSYWRKHEAEGEFDRRILQRYLGTDGAVMKRRQAKPIAFQVQELLGASRGEHWTDAFWLFREIVLARRRVDHGGALGQLLASLAKRFFCISDVSALNAYVDCREGKTAAQRLAILFDFACFCLHVAEFREVESSRPYRGFASRFDVQSSMRLGDLLRAGLSAKVGQGETERLLLRAAWERDPDSFWMNVQRVYRFEKSLEEVIACLPGAAKVGRFETPGKAGRWFFYPEFRRNPYQSLLYGDLRKKGVEVLGLKSWQDVTARVSDIRQGDVFHVHWISQLVKDLPVDQHQAAYDELIRVLEGLRKRGVTLLWTVHNKVSHDSPAIAIEEAFRHRLSCLVDRVFLHHPMQLCDIGNWLAPEARIEVTEHGSYRDIYPNWMTTAEARELLGFDADDIVILIAGYVRPYKAVADKINVLSRWLADDAKRKLLVAGDIACPATRSALLGLPQDQLMVTDRFLEDRELQVYFNAASIVLLTYREILTSGSLMQAMSFARPVLAPVMGSIPYYVADGFNGWLYRDNEALSSLLCSVCCDHGALAALQENCRKAGGLITWPVACDV